MHAPVGGVEPEFDDDEKAVMKYAKENPKEDWKTWQTRLRHQRQGGASASVPLAMQSEADQVEQILELWRNPKDQEVMFDYPFL